VFAMRQEQKRWSSSSLITKQTMIDIYEEGIRHCDELTPSPIDHVNDHRQRLKRFFTSICLHMDDIFDALIKKGCIAKYPLVVVVVVVVVVDDDDNNKNDR